jgi:3-isopropylmalate/(R)-2-methylmalate dehydratase large subunit
LEAAAQLKDLGGYIEKYEIEHWFDQGRGGVCHAIFPEAGLVRPGMVIVGSDSHTCTYGALAAFSSGLGATDVAAAMALGELWLKVPASIKFVFDGALQPMVTGKDLILHCIGKIGVDGALYKAMEFTGETIRNLPIDARFTICNMAVEAGAKNGIIASDETTMQYLEGRTQEPFLTFSSDRDALYEAEYRWDASTLEPVVAQPFQPSNVVPASAVKNVKVDQVVIGSCTNGRISDLRAAAQVMKGKKAARGVRVLVFPATQQIYLQAMREGLLADGEVAIATTNRNFGSRMGHKNSKVYLSSPYTAAASAVAGYIVDPRQVS